MFDEAYNLNNKSSCFEKYKDVSSVLVKGKLSVTKPKISIIIPTYNRIELLDAAINSALSQKNYYDYEVVVGDNSGNANQKTEIDNIIDKYNDNRLLYYKHEKNIGPLGNWNRLIELASGEYITMLHDDDWIDENFLCNAAKRLKGDNLVSFKLRVIKQTKTKANKIKNIIMLLVNLFKICKTKLKAKKLIYYIPNSNLSTFYKRSKLIELGGYNEEHLYNADNMLLVKYIYNYSGVLYRKSYYNYRIMANDTLSACVHFPESGYIYRNAMIEQLCKKKEKNFKRSKLAYDLKMLEMKNKWGVECTDLLAGSEHRNSKFYRLALSMEKIRGVFETITA